VAAIVHPSCEPATISVRGFMRVVVRLQVLQFVRMSVGAMFPGMLVSMLVGIARVGMLVRMLMVMLVAVGVGVFVSVRNPIVGVLVGMGMGVFMPMLVTMIVLTFHRIPLRRARLAQGQFD
jgi:hypothetical protein